MTLELENAVKRELLQIANLYRKIISFVNVKAYYNCMLSLSREFGITTLPREVDWKAARAVPCRNLDELKETLNDVTGSVLVQPIVPQGNRMRS
jgi:hypothetical protein